MCLVVLITEEGPTASTTDTLSLGTSDDSFDSPLELLELDLSSLADVSSTINRSTRGGGGGGLAVVVELLEVLECCCDSRLVVEVGLKASRLS